ncbi:hypothetical protein GGI12_005664 [Dipsacomyces acuminosporus]|nr:hypothetical protein GGI12_005664 [Dipsacomyces acuminosporus]
MTKYSIYTADAFTSVPFRGNQAAVVPVPVDKLLSAEQMQTIAAEMNLSETAFITPKDYAGDDPFQNASRFGLRWFTPMYEAKLCGHATLATAHILFAQLHNKSSTLYFDTLSGELTVKKGENGLLEMVFPLDVPEPVEEIDDDIKVLVAGFFGEYTDSTSVLISPSLRYMLIHDPKRTDEDVKSVVPKLTPEVVAAGKRHDIICFVITAKGSDKDFNSCVFDPWCGILEDPVTGSAHTVLAPFWADRLGKKSFSAHQASKRGGDLEIEIISDTHVAVSGQAVTVIEGTIAI